MRLVVSLATLFALSLALASSPFGCAEPDDDCNLLRNCTASSSGDADDADGGGGGAGGQGG
jgi:hypothetical protein